MIRMCCVLVLVTLAFLPVVRPEKCEQRERSLSDLQLAQDALRQAKDLYPNCKDESASSSECSKRHKSLGYIDAALDLVSNAKKNIPICPGIPTEIPSTTSEDSSTETDEIWPATEAPVRYAMDCQELQEAGIRTSGRYYIWPKKLNEPILVRCDMDTDGGGWTVFQRRGNFSIQENFDRNWKYYKTGFGSLGRDFWLGNDNLFLLSNQGNYSLRMDMTAVGGESAFALYRTFRVADENQNYKLTVGGYDPKGTAGDGMTYSSGEMFTTKDRKNDRYSQHCAGAWKGGFWYYGCAFCNPNGLYKPGVKHESSMWYLHFKAQVGLLSMDMKIKRL